MKDLYHMLNLLGEKYYSSNRMLNIICNDKLSLARHPAVAISVEIGDVDFRICGILILRRFSPICWIMHWKRWRLLERSLSESENTGGASFQGDQYCKCKQTRNEKGRTYGSGTGKCETDSRSVSGNNAV